MDHLLLPNDPLAPYPRVPYICHGLSSCEDVLEYPMSFAIKWNVTVPSSEERFLGWLRPVIKAHGMAEIEPFLQQWIFFGLLQEIFGPLSLFNRSDYMGTDEDGQFVHTKALSEKAECWEGVVEKWDDTRKLELGDRLYHCMSAISRSLFMLCSGIPASDYCNNAIVLSILCTCDAVAGLACARLKQSSGRTTWSQVSGIRISKQPCAAQMLENGWCRSELSLVDQQYSDITTNLFLARMSKRSIGIDHTDCTDDFCKHLQIDDAAGDLGYEPRHANEQCTCRSIGPDVDAVARCLDQGTFPLLRVTGEGVDDVRVEVEPYAEDKPYLAFSHVWVDGLGNPRKTRLPACQALRLRQLAQDLRGRTFIWSGEERTEERSFLLWFDTYCCPTDEEDGKRRRLALARLRDIYSKAAYVIVLDRELESIVHADISTIERAARVATSRWTKRLWTFQEGALAGKLLIKFKDQLADFRDIWDDIRSPFLEPRLLSNMARKFVMRLAQMRSWSPMQSSSVDKIVLLMGGISYRSVSKPSDEPLCLAVVLNLDVGKVASEQEIAGRMRVFWRLLSESEVDIPSDIIFNDLPRLAEEGYRWAPISFRRLSSRPRLNTLSGNAGPRVVWTPHGAQFQGKGWRVELERPVWGFDSADPDVNKSIERMTFIKDLEGQHYMNSSGHKLDGSDKIARHYLLDKSKTWYIILGEHYKPLGGIRRGLLCYAEHKPDHVIHRSIAIMSLTKLDPDLQETRRLLHEYSNALRKHVTVRIFQSQLLCAKFIKASTAWIPTLIQKRILDFLNFILGLAFHNAKRRFQDLLERRGKDFQKIEIVQLLFEGNFPWKQDILSELYGGNIRVTEFYDSSHKWIVD